MSTIISHRKKFVFLHIPKTAGTSVSTLLQPYSDPFFLSSNALRSTLHACGHLTGHDLFNFTGRFILPFHVLAPELQKRFSDTYFDSYYKFTVVRSPWALLYSKYLFLRKRAKRFASPPRFKQVLETTFREFVMQTCTSSPQNQVDFLFKNSNNEIDMSFIAKQEHLNSDIEYVANHLQIPFRSLPYLNATSKSSYVDKYDDSMAEAVQRAFIRDINEFSYTFGDR